MAKNSGESSAAKEKSQYLSSRFISFPNVVIFLFFELESAKKPVRAAEFQEENAWSVKSR